MSYKPKERFPLSYYWIGGYTIHQLDVMRFCISHYEPIEDEL